MTDRKDLVIIGSGPAGLSAAVYAQRAMLDQVVIEKEPFSGGQIITTERIDNYLGLYGMGGYELAMKFREHADALSVPFLEGEVTAINDDGEVKQITLASGETIETKAVLFATGARHKTLSVKGEKGTCRCRRFVLCNLRRCFFPRKDDGCRGRRRCGAGGCLVSFQHL